MLAEREVNVDHSTLPLEFSVMREMETAALVLA